MHCARIDAQALQGAADRLVHTDICELRAIRAGWTRLFADADLRFTINDALEQFPFAWNQLSCLLGRTF
jgi:hypothetical protein